MTRGTGSTSEGAPEQSTVERVPLFQAFSLKSTITSECGKTLENRACFF